MTHADYTAEQLAVDLAVKVTAMAARLELLEREDVAIRAYLNNRGSAHAEFELAAALKAAEVNTP